ncbi:MAG: leucine-rich repeat domain-containing protein, partial [Candidatus Dormibacteraceae bacterium]
MTNLSQVTALGLDGTSVTNLDLIGSLPSLRSLSLTSSPLTNAPFLTSGLSNLINLDLTGDSLQDLAFLTNLGNLLYLSLDHNRITNVEPVSGLSHLQFLSLQQNLVTTITPLMALSELSSADLRLNLLDLSDSSIDWNVISNLTFTGGSVTYAPQRAAAEIDVPAQWFVAADTASTLRIPISDNAAYDAGFTVGAYSSNAALLPNEQLAASEGTNGDWLLRVTPLPGQTGNATITVSATNDAGLTTNASFPLSVVISQPVSIPDPNLQGAIQSALKLENQPLTTVDLLDLIELDLRNAAVSNLAGLESATNVTSLALDDDAVFDLTPLAH